MIISLTYEEFKKSPLFNGLFKLCYIDKISDTIYGYSEESQKIIDDPQFSWKVENEEWQKTRGSRLNYIELPNPEYDKNNSTIYAFFTSISLKEQWGDDWDDYPYNCNAGEPYDDISDTETSTKLNNSVFSISNYRYPYDILKVRMNIHSWDVKLAEDIVENISIRDINAGAVAWIFYSPSFRLNKTPVCIHAGCTAEEFIKKIELIESQSTEWEPTYDDEG